MNYLKTAILLAGLTGLFMGVGYLIGGAGGAVVALVIAAATNLFAYWNSDRMVLSMYGAHEVDARTAPELVGLVAELARRAGLPMPRVFLMDDPQPNAFATGRNPQNAAVAVTPVSSVALSREELAGVIAHELAHIRNHDTLLMTMTATIAGAISMLAQFGMFFGGNRDNNNGPGMVGIDRDDDPGAVRAPCWCRWRSAARANTPPTIWAPASSASRCRSPRRSPRSQRRAPDPERGAERNPATAHHVHRQPAVGARHGQSVLRPTPRPRTASLRCSNSPPNWARAVRRLPPVPTLRAAAPGAGPRPRAGHGGEGVRMGIASLHPSDVGRTQV